MVLTPEDVVNKQFQTTKFREGYDQDEVDDFLDEIVVELQRLNDENENLRIEVNHLKQSDQIFDKNVTHDNDSAKIFQNDDKNIKHIEDQTLTSGKDGLDANNNQQDMNTHSSVNISHESATGVLAMAQKLHDEYVRAGMDQREKIITEAQIEASNLIKDAQDKSKRTIGSLEQQKSNLERRVEQLRNFEQDYRARLKAYIESQLRDLEARGSVSAIEPMNNS